MYIVDNITGALSYIYNKQSFPLHFISNFDSDEEHYNGVSWTNVFAKRLESIGSIPLDSCFGGFKW